MHKLVQKDLDTFAAIARSLGATYRVYPNTELNTAAEADLHFDFTGKAAFSEELGETSWFYLCNPDGSIRWVWPGRQRIALFLETYNTPTLKARIMAETISIMVRLGMGKFVATGRIRVGYSGNAPFSDWLTQVKATSWGLFTGTEGPARKLTLALGHHAASWFVKLPITPEAANAIGHEADMIRMWNSKKLVHSHLPNVRVLTGSQLAFRSMRGHMYVQSPDLTPALVQAVTEWSADAKPMPLNQTGWLQTWRQALTKAEEAGMSTRFPALLQLAGNALADLDPGELVTVSPCHGDFTPWNTLSNGRSASVYDWEQAGEAPMLYDLVYYTMQSGVMLDKKSPTALLGELNSIPGLEQVQKAGSITKPQLERHVYLSFLALVFHYLEQYSRQQALHHQAVTALRTWTPMLAWMNSSARRTRLSFIQNLFTVLREEQYAWMKPMTSHPCLVPEGSDLDICCTAATGNNIIAYLKGNPEVERIEVDRKLHQTMLRVTHTDGKMLHLDLIHGFYRKGVEYLKVEDVLGDSVMTKIGIRKASAEHELAYTSLFYWLNHAPIPAKHLKRLSNWEHPILQGAWFGLSKSHALTEADAEAGLQKVWKIKGNASSSWARKAVSQVRYVGSCLVQFIRPKGVTISISGVDGAGKSTILNNLKDKLTHDRYEVVILRHRPSIFPILSAWTKGKKQAEADAAGRLPRQGGNNSVLLSLPRFAYYFLDYVLGYWLIRARYLSRGYVVLYDRYYYDFMADPRRSNLKLPPFLARIFYMLVPEPELNVFLYAAPEVILSRKQELSESVIRSLTTSYSKLFARLGRNSNHTFLMIENTDLPSTLGQIDGAFHSLPRY